MLFCYFLFLFYILSYWLRNKWKLRGSTESYFRLSSSRIKIATSNVLNSSNMNTCLSIARVASKHKIDFEIDSDLHATHAILFVLNRIKTAIRSGYRLGPDSRHWLTLGRFLGFIEPSKTGLIFVVFSYHWLMGYVGAQPLVAQFGLPNESFLHQLFYFGCVYVWYA